MSETSYVGSVRAAVESFLRTFVQAFIGALAVVNWTTTDLDGAKVALVSAASAALAAAVAGVGRLVLPMQTDKKDVAVKPAANV